MNLPHSGKNSGKNISLLAEGGSLPPPREDRRAGRKIAFLAFLAVCVLAFASWWLGRAPAEKTALRQNAGEIINDALASTPLAGLGDAITPKSEREQAVLAPPTDTGTLAGREVVGTIAAPMDLGPAAGAAGYAVPRSPEALQKAIQEPDNPIASLLGMEKPQQPEITFTQDFVPPAIEDSTVRPGYVEGLAKWLVSRYRTGPAGGSIAAAPRALNYECGASLAARVPGGRKGLLRYAFHPSMLTALYNLYIDRFFDDLDAAAEQKGLGIEQTRQMYGALGGHAALLAQAAASANEVPDLKTRIQRIDQLAQRVVAASSDLTAAVFELDSLREGGADAAVQAAAQSRVAASSDVSRLAEQAHAQAQADLASAIRVHAGPGLDEEALLFVAAWMQRRRDEDPEAQATIVRSIELLRDFAARCARIAEES